MNDQEIIERFHKISIGLKCINLTIIGKHDSELLDFILSRTSFLPDTANLRERLFCIENSISQRPVCPVCRKGFLVFNRKSNSYSSGCCHRCTVKSDEYKEKMISKFGFESPNSAPEVKALKKSKMLEKYGVDNPSKIQEVQDKKIVTSLAKHGVEHWTNVEQARKTYKDKTGYDNPSQNPDVKDKKISTCLKNIGYDNPSKSDDIKEKKRQTCIENYGVEFGFMLDRHIVYNSISNLSKKLYSILDASDVHYEKEFRIYADNTYRAYDIAFLKEKIIIELNGDFWHANPDKFKRDDLINLPHIGKIPAYKIWERDAYKKYLAESHGFHIYYLWEHEIKQMTDTDILNWVFNKLRT